MAYKKTYAFIRGTWDGEASTSNFTQDNTIFASVDEFYQDYSNIDINSLINEYEGLVTRSKTISADGKVMIVTTEYVDEAMHNAYAYDSRWEAAAAASRGYEVKEAPTPEDVNTFNEGSRIYYHSVAHLF